MSKPQSFLLELQKCWNLCNPNEFDETASQDRVRHREKILLLYSGHETGCGLGDCGPECCHSWPSWCLRQGSITVPLPVNQMWKEHCFCTEYSCLLNLLVNGLNVWFLYVTSSHQMSLNSQPAYCATGKISQWGSIWVFSDFCEIKIYQH